MSRSRPASNPISYHKHTKQYYVTRAGRRIYLGSDKDEALKKYYRFGLGLDTVQQQTTSPIEMTIKELANRFLTAQQANWKNPQETLKCYKQWLGRFIEDHPRLKVADFTIEKFASWKLSLKKREYSPESINHFLSGVRSIFNFAEDTGLIEKSPRLRRIKNEPIPKTGSQNKPLYTQDDIQKLLEKAELQMRTMILLALNCGFGPKDIHDLTWDDIDGERVTLPRSKTGVCQTFLLWPETKMLLDMIRKERYPQTDRVSKQVNKQSENGHVFLTRFKGLWVKDAIAEQFHKLCIKANVSCYGFYRLRHCASTAVSLVASPHVQRKFMRHSQLQQQVTYTHTPDSEVDMAIMKTKAKLLGNLGSISDQERNRELEKVV
jgi:integrase